MIQEFKPFPKMARLSRECIISEKIDGTNASVFIRQLADDEVMPTDTPIIATHGDLLIYAGSRTRWITPENDNHGFAKWVRDNVSGLINLGPGHHFGEWWGQGIQRGYGLKEKRFSLFNVIRWCEHHQEPVAMSESLDSNTRSMIPRMQTKAPECCHVVPLIYLGEFETDMVKLSMACLKSDGSYASPGFMSPEGVVVFHVAGNVGFKKTFDGDEAKGGRS